MENLDGLPTLPLAAHGKLPEDGGLYWVSVDGLGVVYVGIARDLRDRWRGHHRQSEIEALGNAWITYLLLPDQATRLAFERAEIVRLRPRLNRTGNPGHPSHSQPDAVRVTIPLDQDLYDRLMDFRFRRRFPHLSHAAHYLLCVALEDA